MAVTFRYVPIREYRRQARALGLSPGRHTIMEGMCPHRWAAYVPVPARRIPSATRPMLEELVRETGRKSGATCDCWASH
jgi:hypothetical protein